MSKVILTQGLPASGKSTWAKEQVKQKGYKRINRDDLRAAVDPDWSKEKEKYIVACRNAMIMTALSAGLSVIVDDTNLNPYVEKEIRALVGDKATIEIKSFLDVPIETCIERDAARTIGQVGEKVIREMAKQIPTVKPLPRINPVVIPYDSNLNDAIIVDVDGTLCLFDDSKNPYDRDFENDIPNIPVITMVRLFKNAHPFNKVIIVSGRNGKFKKVTEEWFKKHGVPYDHFYIRHEKDMRGDTIIKKEIYDAFIKGKFNIAAVVDDRPKVVKMWRELGLFVFDVNQSGKDF